MLNAPFIAKAASPATFADRGDLNDLTTDVHRRRLPPFDIGRE
jgi:hypothetical protein